MTEPTTVRTPSQRSEFTEQTTADLRRAQEIRRLIGDPRVRVQVPTDGVAGEPTPPPAAKRYEIG